MLKDLATAVYPLWILLAMGLFFGIVAWAYWPSRRRKKQMKDYASIPFKDEEGRDRTGEGPSDDDEPGDRR